MLEKYLPWYLSNNIRVAENFCCIIPLVGWKWFTSWGV